MPNFMVADLVQTTLAILAFSVFFLPAGYLLGLASNAFEMRSRPAAEKLLFSLAFSFAAVPIVAVLLTRVSSFKVTLTVFLLLALISLATLVKPLSHPAEIFRGVQRSTWILFGMMLAWFLLVQFSLVDLQIGHRLYVSYVAFDHSVRVPFVEAAARSGVPPRNPFYGLGKVPVLRYFYYWYVVCALPVRLFGFGDKVCFNASVFWSGLGLASTIPLFLKYFLGETDHLRKKSVIGIALLAVTGLDIFPYAQQLHHFGIFQPDMEWWDTNQVSSWLGSLLWVPHHVASLTASMVGLLALSAIEEEAPLSQTAWSVAISAVAFASAAGLSVYVFFTFGVFLIVWSLQTLWQGRVKTFAAYASSGVCTVLLSLPYLSDLLSKQGKNGLGKGERFAFFAIRDYLPALDLLGKMGIHNPWLVELAKVPILLYVYALEFGFFAVILVLCLQRDRRSPTPLTRQQRMAWMMFAVCLLTMSCLKSDTTVSNDLGFRGILVVQFVLLIWSAPIVHDVFFLRDTAAPAGFGAPWIKNSLLCTLILGVASTAVGLATLRCYSLLADSMKFERFEGFLGAPGFAERTYWMRQGFSRLNELTSPRASVQYNPVQDEVLMSHLYSTRQAVIGDANCGSAFGGDIETCRQALPYIGTVFNAPDQVRNWDLDRLCDDFAINVLVANDADPVWEDKESWVWTRPILFANPSLRAVPCGTAAHFQAAP